MHKSSSKLIQALFDRIHSVSDASRNLYSESESLKKIVLAQTNSVQKSSSASHEISSMVSMTAQSAVEMNLKSEKSLEALRNSQDALDEMNSLVNKMRELSQTYETTIQEGLKSIEQVTQTMSEIKDKSKIINEIVFQTKLLSFNASVEAARAGEHGRGFAIVAEEMANLAKASGEASKEIETILNLGVDSTKTKISEVTGKISQVTKENAEMILEVSKKSEKINESFLDLVKFSEETGINSKQITTATQEADIGVKEVSEALGDIQNSSSKLEAVSNSTLKSASELSSQIEVILEDFKTVSEAIGVKLKVNLKPFDFQSAINAHIDWKMKLTKYLQNPDRSLEHKKVSLDNLCVLGKWIYGDGQNFKYLDQKIFEKLRLSHAEFHATAGHVIELLDQNKISEAEKLLAPGGTYIRISDQTVGLIKDLQQLYEVEAASTGKSSAA